VSNKVVSELTVGQVPDLYKLVPSATDNERDRLGRRESDARNPHVVALALGIVSADGVLAFSKGVPQTDGSITRTGNDLTVVNGKGYGKDVLLMSNKSSGGLSGSDVPQSKFTVPRGRKSKGTIGRDNNVRDEVGVSPKSASGESIFVILNVGGGGGGSVVKLPDKD